MWLIFRESDRAASRPTASKAHPVKQTTRVGWEEWRAGVTDRQTSPHNKPSVSSSRLSTVDETKEILVGLFRSLPQTLARPSIRIYGLGMWPGWWTWKCTQNFCGEYILKCPHGRQKKNWRIILRLSSYVQSGIKLGPLVLRPQIVFYTNRGLKMKEMEHW